MTATPTPTRNPEDPTDPDLHEAAARRQAQTARHSRWVSDLLADRTELRGVIPLADLVFEGARWAA